jgi:hypothetical protein
VDDTPYSAKVRAEMFKPEGVVGTFGARIGLGYLLGYFTPDAHADLVTFPKIRNRFAHFAEHNSFGTNSVRTLCANFKLVNSHVAKSQSFVQVNDLERAYFETVGLGHNRVRVELVDPDATLKEAKGRFVTTAKLFCAGLEFFMAKKHPQETYY